MDDGITHRWAECNDELRRHVRQHIWQTRAPETLLGLVKSKPDPAWSDWKPVCRYDLNPEPGEAAREKLHCAGCQHEGRHLKGAVFWFPDGHLRLIGWQCMRDLYGEAEVEAVRAAWEGEQVTEELMQLAEAVAGLIPEAVRAAQELIDSTAMYQAVSFHGQLRARMGAPLDRALGEADQHDGHLTFVTERRDFDRVEGVSRGRQDGRFIQSRHLLQGRPIMIQGAGMRRHKGRLAAARLRELAAELSSPDLRKRSDRQIRALLNDVFEACEAVLDAHAFLREVEGFIDPTNLAALCRWLGTIELRSPSTFKSIPNGIRIERPVDDAVEVRMPLTYMVSTILPVAQLRSFVARGR